MDLLVIYCVHGGDVFTSVHVLNDGSIPGLRNTFSANFGAYQTIWLDRTDF
jgi:hypothetical protein